MRTRIRERAHAHSRLRDAVPIPPRLLPTHLTLSCAFRRIIDRFACFGQGRVSVIFRHRSYPLSLLRSSRGSRRANSRDENKKKLRNPKLSFPAHSHLRTALTHSLASQLACTGRDCNKTTSCKNATQSTEPPVSPEQDSPSARSSLDTSRIAAPGTPRSHSDSVRAGEHVALLYERGTRRLRGG